MKEKRKLLGRYKGRDVVLVIPRDDPRVNPNCPQCIKEKRV